MEKKEPIKVSLPVFIAIIILLVAIVYGIFMYSQKMQSDKEIANLKDRMSQSQEAVNKVNAEKNELQEKLNSIEEITSTDNNKQNITNNSKVVVPSLLTSTSQETIDGLEYKVTAKNRNFEISINNGIPSIFAYATTKKSEIAEYAGIDVNDVNINFEAKDIKGFNKKVVDVCIILDNNEPGTDTFLFLMEDGTVQYSNYKNMVQNISVQGTLNQLKNIVKLQTVSYTDGVSGDTSAFAIDKDNKCFDVRKYIKN